MTRPVESALAAAEALRALNHATLPRTGALVFPADAYDVLTALAVLATRLPQALGQIGAFLDEQCEHERIRVVDGEHRDDPVAAITTCAVHLEHTGAAAQRLGEALDAAAAALCWAAATEAEHPCPTPSVQTSRSTARPVEHRTGKHPGDDRPAQPATAGHHPKSKSHLGITIRWPPPARPDRS